MPFATASDDVTFHVYCQFDERSIRFEHFVDFCVTRSWRTRIFTATAPHAPWVLQDECSFLSPFVIKGKTHLLHFFEFLF